MYKMKYLSGGLLILALLFGTVIQAGTVGKIVGKVTNTQTGEPLQIMVCCIYSIQVAEKMPSRLLL